MGLNKFYGTNRNKSMLAVFICHQVRLTHVCNDTTTYVRFCNFPPPGSVGGVASALSPKKEKTPGFQRTVSLKVSRMLAGWKIQSGRRFFN